MDTKRGKTTTLRRSLAALLYSAVFVSTWCIGESLANEQVHGQWTSGRGTSEIADRKGQIVTGVSIFNTFSPHHQASINAAAIKEHGTEFLMLVDVRGHDENAVYSLINRHLGSPPPAAENGSHAPAAEDAAPALAVASGSWPEFSWDAVPFYIHVGKNSGFTDGEIEFVATHSSFVRLEKGHGMIPHGSTEKGIEHDAVRLKEANPKMKVIYYWNTFLDYSMYDAKGVQLVKRRTFPGYVTGVKDAGLYVIDEPCPE